MTDRTAATPLEYMKKHVQLDATILPERWTALQITEVLTKILHTKLSSIASNFLILKKEPTRWYLCGPKLSVIMEKKIWQSPFVVRHLDV